jgi:predicted DNA-binding ArsR family transcriptional regulator
VDYTAAHAEDTSKGNAKAAMRTQKRVGVRFGPAAQVISILHALNVKSTQIQMIAESSTILCQKSLDSSYVQTGQRALLKLKRLELKDMQTR